MDKKKCSSCGETKCSCKNKEFTKAVIEIDNPEQITLMRKVVIPASMGDDTTVPPTIGKYHNVLLYYEANSKSYLYSSDGIPTQLNNGITNYEDAINLPQINGVTLLGDKSAADLELADAPMVITVASGNTSWSGADTAEDVYDFFLNKGKVNIIFNGDENYSYEIASAAYIPGEEKMMCTLAVSTIVAGETAEFDGNALFGTMTLYTANKAIDVSQIELQPKLYVTDFTGLDLNYNELSGVPATNASIGMVKSGNGLEVASDGTLSISEIEQYAHFFDTVADMKAATNLVAGDYAKTLGFHSINDGGGALYKVTDTGTANEMDVIAVGSLYATLIKPATITPEIYGAYGDDTHDDTASIQRTIDLNKNIVFSKNYLINTSITVGNQDTSTNNLLNNVNIDAQSSTVTYTGNGSAFVLAGIKQGYINFGKINASNGNCIEMWSSNGYTAITYLDLTFKELRAGSGGKAIYIHSSSTGFINQNKFSDGTIFSGAYGFYIEQNPSSSAYNMNGNEFNRVSFEGCDVCYYINALAQEMRGFRFYNDRTVENLHTKWIEISGKVQDFEWDTWSRAFEDTIDFANGDIRFSKITAPIWNRSTSKYEGSGIYINQTTKKYLFNGYVSKTLTKETGVTGTILIVHDGNNYIMSFVTVGISTNNMTVVTAANNPLTPGRRYYGTLTDTNGHTARVTIESTGEVKIVTDSSYVSNTFDGQVIFNSFAPESI